MDILNVWTRGEFLLQGASNVDIIYYNITHQMQILLDKIKIELFVLNFQKVYSIFLWLIGGPSEAGALSNCLFCLCINPTQVSTIIILK